MLKDVTYPPEEEYRSGSEHEPFSFYLESLLESDRLDLLLGYFSSSAINVLALGFAKFLSNGGQVRLVINHILSRQDKQAIIKGLASEGIDEGFSINDFNNLKTTLDDYGRHFFDCLAWLIANKRITIRAIKPNGKKGISHYKSGVFYDGKDKVKFKGSCNFTASGLLENLEELDLRLSWKTDQDVFSKYEKEYNSIFDGKAAHVTVIPFDDVEEAILRDHGNKDLNELLVNEQHLLEQKSKQNYSLATSNLLQRVMLKLEIDRASPRFPFESNPRPYQEEAYKNWVANGCCGIFAMATGTGKTITALNCCLNESKKTGSYQVVILVPTTILVEQWEKECKAFNFKNIIKCSSRSQGWKDALADLRNSISFGVENSFIVVATYRTFANAVFQSFLKVMTNETVLIADEVHNVGSPIIAALFSKLELTKRIGLSATPKRTYDDVGTERMESFFHDAPPYTYSFSMERAINEKILCSYYYYPRVVELTPHEMKKYNDISAKLAGLYNRINNDSSAKKSFEMLLMERKRIIHKATSKLGAFEAILQEICTLGENEPDKYPGLRYTLVYAPEGYYDENESDLDFYPAIPDDSRIIDYYANAVRKVSPSTLVMSYTSGSSEKDHTLSSFENGKLDVLLSMKCLDEGVDIPRTEQAIFCASTGNPRQFIQRRGRILRQHKQKRFARIYDLVVVPSSIPSDASFDLEQKLVSKEMERVVDFAYMAMNRAEAIGAIQQICNRYLVNLDELDPYSQQLQ